MVVYCEQTIIPYNPEPEREFPYGVSNTTMVRLSEYAFLDLVTSPHMDARKKFEYKIRKASKEEIQLYNVTRLEQKIKDHC